MRKNIILTMLVLFISYSIILVGCGGGSGTIHPASLYTPTPNYTGTGKMIYVTFNVKWPEHGKAGKIIPFKLDQPVDANTALRALNSYQFNPDPVDHSQLGGEYPMTNSCTLFLQQKNPNENIYFPVPVTVNIVVPKK
jgi:hypothetical protein